MKTVTGNIKTTRIGAKFLTILLFLIKVTQKSFRRILYSFLVIYTPLFSFIATAEIYKSVDENGRITFTDRKQEIISQEVVPLDESYKEWKRFVIEIDDEDSLLSENERERIGRDVNVVYSFYDDKMFFDIYKVVPVKIKLLKDEASYYRYLATKYNYNKRGSRGIFMYRTNEIVVWLNPVRWRTFWTIKHEVSHSIIKTLMPYIPAWLNEGMAENMEAIGIGNNNKYYLLEHKENFGWINRNKANLALMNVSSKVLSLTSLQWRQHGSQAQVGELVRMLLSNPSGQRFIVRLLHVFERGDNTLCHIHVQNLYIGGIPVLQANWNKWINREKSVFLDI